MEDQGSCPAFFPPFTYLQEPCLPALLLPMPFHSNHLISFLSHSLFSLSSSWFPLEERGRRKEEGGGGRGSGGRDGKKRKEEGRQKRGPGQGDWDRLGHGMAWAGRGAGQAWAWRLGRDKTVVAVMRVGRQLLCVPALYACGLAACLPLPTLPLLSSHFSVHTYPPSPVLLPTGSHSPSYLLSYTFLPRLPMPFFPLYCLCLATTRHLPASVYKTPCLPSHYIILPTWHLPAKHSSHHHKTLMATTAAHAWHGACSAAAGRCCLACPYILTCRVAARLFHLLVLPTLAGSILGHAATSVFAALLRDHLMYCITCNDTNSHPMAVEGTYWLGQQAGQTRQDSRLKRTAGMAVWRVNHGRQTALYVSGRETWAWHGRRALWDMVSIPGGGGGPPHRLYLPTLLFLPTILLFSLFSSILQQKNRKTTEQAFRHSCPSLPSPSLPLLPLFALP